MTPTWKPFRVSTQRHAPKAVIMFDKFHIVKHLGDALDAIRRSEYNRVTGEDRSFIKGQRYVLLSRRENLTDDRRKNLERLLQANARLNIAYLLREQFEQLWDYADAADASKLLRRLARAIVRSGPRALRKIRRHDRAQLGQRRRLQPTDPRHPARLRRGSQQQNPRPPTPRLRPARRRISQTQNPHMWTAAPGKHFFDVSNDLVDCGHMSGLLARSIFPLALMKSDNLDPYQVRELCAHDD